MYSECPFCNGDHNLDECSHFKCKPMNERKSFFFQRMLCLGCGMTDLHQIKDCPDRKICKECEGQHLTCLAQKCRSASFALHRIRRIRSFLDKQTAERLVHAFVMCHIDFCNSLLQGLPAGQIQRLQTIQNSAARLVSRTKKYQSISPVLQSFHWLPVHYRIMFKILLLSYQCFHNLAPSYLTELLTIYKPGRNLRSGKKKLFCNTSCPHQDIWWTHFCSCCPNHVE